MVEASSFSFVLHKIAIIYKMENRNVSHFIAKRPRLSRLSGMLLVAFHKYKLFGKNLREKLGATSDAEMEVM